MEQPNPCARPTLYHNNKTYQKSSAFLWHHVFLHCPTEKLWHVILGAFGWIGCFPASIAPFSAKLKAWRLKKERESTFGSNTLGLVLGCVCVCVCALKKKKMPEYVKI
uniref:Uncharacterized protein n=1 Tax=Nelumbo nucifera TaxID=4432 RepID=A0A822Y6S6_NELNU|nr:TPA_asm: hypothetical protein HUJ06_028203 [Nelumbo nucifera]